MFPEFVKIKNPYAKTVVRYTDYDKSAKGKLWERLYKIRMDCDMGSYDLSRKLMALFTRDIDFSVPYVGEGSTSKHSKVTPLQWRRFAEIIDTKARMEVAYQSSVEFIHVLVQLYDLECKRFNIKEVELAMIQEMIDPNYKLNQEALFLSKKINGFIFFKGCDQFNKSEKFSAYLQITSIENEPFSKVKLVCRSDHNIFDEDHILKIQRGEECKGDIWSGIAYYPESEYEQFKLNARDLHVFLRKNGKMTPAQLTLPFFTDTEKNAKLQFPTHNVEVEMIYRLS